jgi:hypothetical protein
MSMLVMMPRRGLMPMSTAVQEIRQDHLDPKEDLSEHSGQWVALRDGKVVGAALDPITLRDRADARDSDVLMLVPAAGSGIFVA